MGVLDLEPHTLVCYDTIGGYEDEHGYYHESKREEQCRIKCKAVPDSGKANVIQFEDGKTAKVAFTCFLHTQRVFHFGEQVTLILSRGVEKDYLVAGYIPYQMKTKVWLAI